MKRSERSDAEIQLSKQVVQTFLSNNAILPMPPCGTSNELAKVPGMSDGSIAVDPFS